MARAVTLTERKLTNRIITSWINELGPTSHSETPHICRVAEMPPAVYAELKNPAEKQAPFKKRSNQMNAIARKILKGIALTEVERTFVAKPLNRMEERKCYRRVQELKKLRDRFDIVRLGVTSSREIVIKTPPLTIRGSSDLGNGVETFEHPIGRWWIGVLDSPTVSAIYVWPINKPAGWYYRECPGLAAYHPHLNTVGTKFKCWGKLCQGAAKVDIHRWFKEGHWERAFLKVIEQMETYSYPGAYAKIKFHLNPSCGDCQTIMTGDVCDICNPECEGCNTRRHKSLYMRCSPCGCSASKALCCDPLHRCRSCGIYTCALCRESYGKDCYSCTPQSLTAIGVFYAELEENASRSVPTSVEPVNVLGSSPQES